LTEGRCNTGGISARISMVDQTLTGLRIFVVEDETLVSLVVEDFLMDRMCVVVGPYFKVETALDAARDAEIDFALLDVNIGGAKVYPVAELLHARQIPFLFLSGYGSEAVPADRPEWRVCSKPFKFDDLASEILAELNRKARPVNDPGLAA
jgi:DNA-binding response OmpR family regulator